MATERLEGTVAEWNARGYGFLHSSDGRRAYVHNSQSGGQHLVQGEAITAIYVPDEKNPGKYQAMDVERLNPGVAVVQAPTAAAAADDSALASNGTFVDTDALQEGTVQEWNERGFGFIGLSDGRRAYVHNSQCGGAHLVKGATVYAIIIPDDKNPGKFQAMQVQQICGATTSPSSVPASVAFAQQPAAVGQAASLDQSGRAEGIVQEWNERGYGFIGFADGRRAYVHNSQCGGAHLTKGETVSAVVTEDQKNPGKFQATAVQRQTSTHRPNSVPASVAFAPSSATPTPTVATPQGERVDGVVSEWNERGYGFITFGDGRRAYVHNTECGGEHLSVGEAVSAIVTADSKNAGKLAASAVQRGSAGEDGVVQDWKVDGGYGFLLMDDKRRVYVHRSNLGGVGDLFVGQRLRVTTKPDVRNPGKWCVSDIKGEITDDPSAGAQAAAGTNDDGSVGAAAGGEADGTVSEWKESGYGFLAMDDGRRVYVHRSRFGGTGHLVVGQRLRVTTQLDPRNPGKYCVDQVLGELLDASAEVGESAPTAESGPTVNNQSNTANVACADQQAGGEAQEGTVSDWKNDGGYGFLNLDDGKRVYVHRSCFGGAGSLVVGSRVQVTIKGDPRNPGKWSVDQVIAGDVVMEESPAKRARVA
eukprot:TRINITY_DN757_c0_g1_i4.p1 TRINITY_DN757_c0_g1~~TRINITY_DN757_c0_g1_i4.p1  ORF type:complete len:674 (+),score=108.63 TRINITY_DN757_c0_g1_i4:85-2022(+)